MVTIGSIIHLSHKSTSPVGSYTIGSVIVTQVLADGFVYGTVSGDTNVIGNDVAIVAKSFASRGTVGDLHRAHRI